MDKQQGQKILSAGATLAIAEPVFAHFGGPGVIVGLGAAGLAYLIVDEVQKAKAGGNPSPATVPEKKPDTGKPSIVHRLLNGKSVRETEQPTKQTQPQEVTQAIEADDKPMETLQPKSRVRQVEQDEDDLKSLEDMLQQSNNTLPGRCMFSTILRTFIPTKDHIFLGYLAGGQAVYVALEDLCHVALAGLTGNGKTTLIRLIVSQVEYVGAKVVILNPHYTSYDIKKHEDWTPIERHLYRPPVTDFTEIGGMMKWAATVLLRDRLEKYRQSVSWGSPIFIVVDELPAIVKQVPEFPEYVSAILREGRKVDIFLIVASQDFLAKTVGPEEGGAVRKNYKTKMYVGGDVTTAKVLLDMPPAQIPESQLGGGIIMMRNQAVKTASLARVPYVDNEALYKLLGPSTYVASKHHLDEEEDDLVGSLMHSDYEQEKRETEPLPQTRRHAQRSAYDAFQERKTHRKVPVYAAREQAHEERGYAVAKVPEMVDEEFERGMQVYEAGARTLDAFQASMGFQKQHQARQLWARVKIAFQDTHTK